MYTRHKDIHNTHTHTHTDAHRHTHVRMHTHTHTHTQTHTGTHTHTHTHTDAHRHTHTHTHTYTHTARLLRQRFIIRLKKVEVIPKSDQPALPAGGEEKDGDSTAGLRKRKEKVTDSPRSKKQVSLSYGRGLTNRLPIHCRTCPLTAIYK